ncbi:ATP-binding protein [Actinacidiphila acidipaludis]|uniref:ATP-binding protein n=1 Tax=Actinacidiphila acidipaludis TaxID=2873382 RepID=A0ABS7Q4J5_9ACTN|nr:ATP-binding protein [Streptomyces acidipaludis]MBY8877335.1 ATP-binding protein [Streptomyces acidipaludis]
MNISHGDGEHDVLRPGRGSDLLLRHSFEAESGSIAMARYAVKRFLDALDARCPSTETRAAGDVLLAVSELVTNVVRHTTGPGLLVMSYREGLVTIVVRDSSTEPVRSPERVTRLDGRGGLGWPLLQELTTALAVVPLVDGKEIHAHLPWPTERSDP